MVRTRFAPSPTGFLHIGGARTALYCYLYARKTQGTFILRIEDTDVERSTPESVQAILDGMEWLNLSFDEGPFYQTNRFERYKEVTENLLKSGHAYRCYCSKERLDMLREDQMAHKQKPRYDGRCRDLKEPGTGPYVIRFKNPLEGTVEFEDQIRGHVSFDNKELDDLIIARTDGTPTYNFTVVVDDYDMKVSHVIRGDDHINNTPRQINILRAMGAETPIYAHLPMILGADGKRLSKRHGAVSVLQYREDGFLPEALLNYLVRLGWSHGDQEIFSMEEMIQYFDTAHINRAAAAINNEKLLWLNQHYMKNGEISKTVKELSWHMEKARIDTSEGPSLEDIIKIQAERTKTIKEMAERSRYFYEEVKLSDELRVHLTPEIVPALQSLLLRIEALQNWDKESVHQTLASVAEEHGLKLGKLAQPVRVAMTGGTVSPSIDITMIMLKKDRVIKRIKEAILFIDKGAGAS